MKTRFLELALLIFCGLSPANAATIRYDFSSNSPDGFFVVDTSTDTVTDWYIVSGPLLGGGDYTHYAGGPSQSLGPAGTASFGCQISCVAQFTTQGSGASAGEVDLTLTWLASLLTTGTVNVLETESSASFQGTGPISLTVLVPDLPTPLPATLPLFATGLSAMGLIAWRRKRKARAGA